VTRQWTAAILLALLAAGPTRAEEVRRVPDSILETGKPLYSQNREELIVRHFFDDRRDGVFLDVGSYRWRDLSTTYYLEHHLGWSGIAIDAQQAFAADYATHRPRTKFFSYIITDHSGTTETLYLADALSSTSREHMAKFPDLRGVEPKKVSVPTMTLDELLDREKVKTIDFLSMDIEGSEPAALARFDIERFRPKLVCIEKTPSVREQITKYFAAHGYQPIERYNRVDRVNWWFAPRPPAPARP